MGADGTVERAAAVRVTCSLAVPADELREPTRWPVDVRVTIQDVTMVDESSTTVAETTRAARSSGDVAGPFELEAELEEGRQYAVYAHVDRSGDGSVSVGDLINTVRIPVRATPGGHQIHVEVPVREVD